MVKKRPATINEYIEAAPPEARSHLRQLNSSSVSNGFMFAAVVKRKNKP